MATVGTARADSPAPPVQRRASPVEERLPPGQPQSTLIGSVQRAMRLLEAVADREYGAPAKQLAREVGLALPTAYHLLRTLTHEGYLRREKGLFFLGDAAERLSSGAVQQKRRSVMDDALAQWRDSIGAPVYYAVYREGEIEVLSVADSPGTPAVAEWADFRETGHAHAIGQCLLSQLDEEARRDHIDRYPVRSITPYTVRDEHILLRRLDRIGRMEPVLERQEYALGTVCAAVPITAGATAATVAISLPAHQTDRLLSAAYRLQAEVGRLVGTLAVSINI
ncbi:p-hydroxybenzoate hydroxylase transcriptional activator [Streptomyces sp. MBT84]|uniref:IclR family transcriptional regulator n=1 Tax=unclassified Streptomyces TaxID=2593676 RepID=UPI00099ED0ED|nr:MULTISPECIES: IclR family transcriptional regulator C-terminal domain-containing protein [unclassified Streptomyces]MBW8702210.1 p-hydroxybenzoate hydroxylase transcriptional activator [Streptomyces sp. MBT84]MDX3259023.1 IclR family transcriptional regulator C-terminal domain-containing protein [Streptomyces sp. MI02-2A]